MPPGPKARSDRLPARAGLRPRTRWCPRQTARPAGRVGLGAAGAWAVPPGSPRAAAQGGHSAPARIPQGSRSAGGRRMRVRGRTPHLRPLRPWAPRQRAGQPRNRRPSTGGAVHRDPALGHATGRTRGLRAPARQVRGWTQDPARTDWSHAPRRDSPSHPPPSGGRRAADRWPASRGSGHRHRPARSAASHVAGAQVRGPCPAFGGEPCRGRPGQGAGRRPGLGGIPPSGGPRAGRRQSSKPSAARFSRSSRIARRRERRWVRRICASW